MSSLIRGWLPPPKFVCLLLVALFFGLLMFPVRCLVVTDASGRAVFVRRVNVAEEFSFRHIHSVERTPWEHFYLVENGGKVSLSRMRFKAFGAGVPNFAPIVRFVDGWTEYAGFTEEWHFLTLSVDEGYEQALVWRGEHTYLESLVPAGTNVRLFIAFRPVGYYWLRIVSGE